MLPASASPILRRHPSRAAGLFVVLVGFVLSRLDAANPDGLAVEHFEKRVRPILAANCYGCHGDQRQEGGLRLDSREGMLQGGDRGPAIDPKSADKSLLLIAIRQLPDQDVSMPPEGKLQPEEIRALEQWLRSGAPWPAHLSKTDNAASAAEQHWAFQKVRRPAIPGRTGSEWEQSPIDRFVLTKLDAAKLAPSPLADRRTLARRFAIDLHGLPPSPETIRAFEEDPSPDATERYVDRLLAAPQFGERWARVWLDIARYADNKGYVFFEEKSYPWAYTYRDYVVRSFNADLPYDRFVMEQLAADLLPDRRDVETIAALGFLTVGGHFMNNTHDIIDDRMDVMTRGLMGLTVTCARCHDHKYDPIPQADYYSLYGILRSCQEPTVPPRIDVPREDEESHKFIAEMEDREKRLVQFVTQKHAGLVQGARTRVREYLTAAQAMRGRPATDNFMLLVDEGDLNPTMILRWQVYLENPKRERDPIWAAWWLMAGLPPEEFSNRAPALWQAARASGMPMHSAIVQAFEARFPNSFADVIERYAEQLVRVQQSWTELVAKAASEGRPAPTRLEDSSDEELRQVLYGNDGPPNVPLTMDWGFLSLFPDRPTQGQYQKLLKEVETWMISGPAAPPRAMALFDAPQPHEPRVFLRGNPNRLGESVPRQFLRVAQPNRAPITGGSGRMQVAQAIVSPDNPLTARVIVNRLWLQHMGLGLVRTPGDFGMRSEPPTHPELLDWLAAELLQLPRSPQTGSNNSPDTPWSLKQLHRRILTSAVFQQSSRIRPEVVAEDPENRLWASALVRRLDWEAMRDSILSASGDLDLAIGGKPVPLWDSWNSRRTLYGVIDRLDTPTLLSTFDFPSPSVSSPARGETTVAPQSLYWMNSGLVAEAARRAIRRPDIVGIPDKEGRLRRWHEVLFGRPASPEELAIAAQYLGESPTDERWANYAHGLMMTNEFLYID